MLSRTHEATVAAAALRARFWLTPAGLAAGGGGLAEVARGGAEEGDEQLGALEVDVIAGEAGGDVAEGLLDGGVGVEIVDEEHVVLDHGEDVVGAVEIGRA